MFGWGRGRWRRWRRRRSRRRRRRWPGRRQAGGRHQQQQQQQRVPCGGVRFASWRGRKKARIEAPSVASGASLSSSLLLLSFRDARRSASKPIRVVSMEERVVCVSRSASGCVLGLERLCWRGIMKWERRGGWRRQLGGTSAAAPSPSTGLAAPRSFLLHTNPQTHNPLTHTHIQLSHAPLQSESSVNKGRPQSRRTQPTNRRTPSVVSSLRARRQRPSADRTAAAAATERDRHTHPQKQEPTKWSRSS